MLEEIKNHKLYHRTELPGELLLKPMKRVETFFPQKLVESSNHHLKHKAWSIAYAVASFFTSLLAKAGLAIKESYALPPSERRESSLQRPAQPVHIEQTIPLDVQHLKDNKSPMSSFEELLNPPPPKPQEEKAPEALEKEPEETTDNTTDIRVKKWGEARRYSQEIG